MKFDNYGLLIGIYYDCDFIREIIRYKGRDADVVLPTNEMMLSMQMYE